MRGGYPCLPLTTWAAREQTHYGPRRWRERKIPGVCPFSLHTPSANGRHGVGGAGATRIGPSNVDGRLAATI
jgi:hypothetical protein